MTSKNIASVNLRTKDFLSFLPFIVQQFFFSLLKVSKEKFLLFKNNFPDIDENGFVWWCFNVMTVISTVFVIKVKMTSPLLCSDYVHHPCI